MKKVFLLFYIPYGNNLKKFAKTIRSQIISGVKTDYQENLIIRVLTHNGDGDMTLLQFTKTSPGGIVYEVDLNKGTDPKSISYLLENTWKNDPDTLKVLTIMGHSDSRHICREGDGDECEWMTLETLAKTIKKSVGFVDLLFFQNCALGNIYALNAVSGVARYVLASQNVMSAPNTYYGGLLQGVKEAMKNSEFEITPQFIAANIAAYEQMAFTLTLYDMTAFNQSEIGKVYQGCVTVPPEAVEFVSYKSDSGAEQLIDLSDLALILPRSEFHGLKIPLKITRPYLHMDSPKENNFRKIVTSAAKFDVMEALRANGIVIFHQLYDGIRSVSHREAVPNRVIYQCGLSIHIKVKEE